MCHSMFIVILITLSNVHCLSFGLRTIFKFLDFLNGWSYSGPSQCDGHLGPVVEGGPVITLMSHCWNINYVKA